jgi:hypothetical protein
VQVGADMLAKEKTAQEGGTEITWDFNNQVAHHLEMGDGIFENSF